MTSQPITLYKIYIKSVHCKCKSHCFNTADINFFRKFKGLKLATSQLLLTIVRVYILYLFKLTTYLKNVTCGFRHTHESQAGIRHTNTPIAIMDKITTFHNVITLPTTAIGAGVDRAFSCVCLSSY